MKTLILSLNASLFLAGATIDSGTLVTYGGSVSPSFSMQIASSDGGYSINGGGDGILLPSHVLTPGILIQYTASTGFDPPNASFVVGGVPMTGLLAASAGSQFHSRNSTLRLRSESFVLGTGLTQTASFAVVSSHTNLYGTIDGLVPLFLITDIAPVGGGTVTFEFRNFLGPVNQLSLVSSTWTFETPEPTTAAGGLGGLLLCGWASWRARSRSIGLVR